jgi:hypothetical protein
MEDCVGPGELTRNCEFEGAGFTFKVFQEPDFWQSQKMKVIHDWSVCPEDHSGCHTFSYNTLQAAAAAICPSFGTSAFFSVWGRPSIMGAIPKSNAQVERVILAAPQALVLKAIGGFAAGTLVPVISESSENYGITRIGLCQVVDVPKSNLKIVCPLRVEYKFYSNLVTMYFRRSILDHYAFYE